MAHSVDQLVALLGGWPDHFTDRERQHGRSILAQLNRDKMIDEGVFGMVVRYATHRAAFDDLSEEIKASEFRPTIEQNLSGIEQARAYHENRLLLLEKELLATPYQRAKAGGKQASFLDQLDAPPPDDGGKVMPFQPLRKRPG